MNASTGTIRHTSPIMQKVSAMQNHVRATLDEGLSAIAVARNAAAAAGLHKYSRTRRLSATATQSSAETASPTASSTVDVLLILNSPHVDR